MAKKPEDVEDMPVIMERGFSEMFAHGIQMYEHVLESTGADEEVIENTTVTIGADFLLDLIDYVVMMGCRYEGMEEYLDELVMMYEVQAKTRSGFGSKTKH